MEPPRECGGCSGRTSSACPGHPDASRLVGAGFVVRRPVLPSCNDPAASCYGSVNWWGGRSVWRRFIKVCRSTGGSRAQFTAVRAASPAYLDETIVADHPTHQGAADSLASRRYHHRFSSRLLLPPRLSPSSTTTRLW